MSRYKDYLIQIQLLLLEVCLNLFFVENSSVGGGHKTALVNIYIAYVSFD